MAGDYFVKKLLADGFLGRPYDIDVRLLTAPYADADAPLHWRQDSQISGYNTLALGMYCEVLHRWFGWQKRVQAIVKAHVPQRRRPDTGELAEVKIADSLAIASEFENGALASWHCSGVTRHGAPNMIELYGSDGTLRYNIDTDEILGARAGDSDLRPMPIPADLRREWLAEAEFLEAIRTGNRDVSPSFTEGIKYIEFTEAVYRSSAEGRADRTAIRRGAGEVGCRAPGAGCRVLGLAGWALAFGLARQSPAQSFAPTAPAPGTRHPAPAQCAPTASRAWVSGAASPSARPRRA